MPHSINHRTCTSGIGTYKVKILINTVIFIEEIHPSSIHMLALESVDLRRTLWENLGRMANKIVFVEISFSEFKPSLYLFSRQLAQIA